ncbi:RAMP superfamily CRISPR-associated protein [Phormidium sp. CCY1219]|uniref:RAMP superfamily CRISPR-associated protein n=1 Tax=Phormidium sp. CCY1219 TaxID=2886104 RepID=UPI002D1F7898|nr:RAMP superfamily CRISPR-associated protein [Phormidium sp. CCY1219]MEB3830785.1 RAMP superfamily CRISPR-associated protein [Phormidium sp. CCY1219]
MTPLPETLPQWYSVREDEDRGWTPKTCNIIRKPENKVITQAWNGSFYPPDAQESTVSLSGLQVISPLQVGGGSFPEGGILPAQVGGVAWIPGSSIRGALLTWLNKNWQQLSAEERGFWETLVNSDRSGWQPRKIRFESVFLRKELEPFPLHAQQSWQVFNQKSNNLGVQWQVSPVIPPTTPPKFSVQVLLAHPVSDREKNWLKTRLEEMLKQQGVGRGTASGFGRIARSLPLTATWEIALTGTKPAIQQQDNKENIVGKYRWSPQVLRACLRGYFTRVALSLLSPDNAKTLTSKIFGGLNSPARLILTSYLTQCLRSPKAGKNYANIPAKDAHSTWIIRADCTREFHDLIDPLLNIASRIGGLGPGWRRPPHVLTRFNGYRGSEFTLTPKSEDSIDGLIEGVRSRIRCLAAEYKLPTFQQPRSVPGGIVSIWQGEPDAWEAIVHGVCSSTNNSKPDWCGNSTTRPSGYAVREYDDCCWITVFDAEVEPTLRQQQFTQIWPA